MSLERDATIFATSKLGRKGAPNVGFEPTNPVALVWRFTNSANRAACSIATLDHYIGMAMVGN